MLLHRLPVDSRLRRGHLLSLLRGRLPGPLQEPQRDILDLDPVEGDAPLHRVTDLSEVHAIREEGEPLAHLVCEGLACCRPQLRSGRGAGRKSTGSERN